MNAISVAFIVTDVIEHLDIHHQSPIEGALQLSPILVKQRLFIRSEGSLYLRTFSVCLSVCLFGVRVSQILNLI